MTLIEKILDIARWAPSGDNTQPWRFETLDERHFVVHGFDTRDHCVYDLDGHPSQIAIGALLENIEIAAAESGHKVEIRRRQDMPEERPTFDVFLTPDGTIRPDPLFPYIPLRATQRRCMSARPLTQQEKLQLEDSIRPNYQVLWLDGWKNKLQAANLMFRNAKIRLTMPEAYEVHKSVIEWDARYSDDKIPDKAIGLDPVATRMMKWTLESWKRVNFFNTFLAGTVLPRIELDWLPGLFCAAHFVLLANKELQVLDDYVNAGRATQRFWLTATMLGLHVQPEMTPLIFYRYIKNGVEFTKAQNAKKMVPGLVARFEDIIKEGNRKRGVFVGRVGKGKSPWSRSKRLALDILQTPNREVG